MSLICPSCKAENDESAETCFTCGNTLTAVVTRGTLIAHRYEILSPLGKGGMGVVYKAHDKVLDETVAIKVLRPDVARSPDMAKRFMAEIKLARRVRHRNVCGIHEYGDEGGLRYISMEYIEGVDLRQMLRTGGPLLVPAALDIAIQTADGLQAIHDVGIVHRDLKTPNIMRDTKGFVRLMDFGIAKQMGTETGTATGVVLGTPEYMSPEQARGQRLDVRSDIYSLGVVIFEVLTGDVPFRGETALATVMKHLHDPLPFDEPRAAGIPELLHDVLNRALAKDPEDRYPSAEGLARSLREVRHRVLGDPASALLPSIHGTAALAPAAWAPAPTPVPSSVPTASVPTRPHAPGRLHASRLAASTRPDTPDPVEEKAQGPRPLRPVWLAAGGLTLVLGTLWVRDALEPSLTGAPTPTLEPSVVVTMSPESVPSPVVVSTLPPEPTPEVQKTPLPPEPTPEVQKTPLPRVVAARPRPSIPAPRPEASPPPAVSLATPPVVAPLPTTTLPEPPQDPGFLLVVVRPWADVIVDGAPRGQTPLPRFSVAAGSHTVRLNNPSYETFEKRVFVRPGATELVRIDLASEGVRKNH
jgi:serine/threonine protein kinase